VAALATLARFDHCVFFGYAAGPRPPIDLFDTFDAEKHRIHVVDYVCGPYLLDPFHQAARDARSGFWRMREVAPDRFFSSEYFRSYYGATGLAEEVGFFVPLAEETAVVVSLMRHGASGPFSNREIGLLRAIAPLFCALAARRFAGLAARFDAAAPDRDEEGATTGSVWRRLNLTDREASVVELVLQGHSSESIARLLDISTGTVKVHRRNVYRKLDISSQTQLLSLYLRSLAAPG
jgi:DNA-binding CsgD family transcriptional regulator